MLHHVQDCLTADTAQEFHRPLTDGTIAAREPDGREIVASMGRARLTSPGIIEWTGQCFCPTPPAHARESVYGRFFDGTRIRPIRPPVEIAGASFINHLAEQASGV